MTIKKTSLNQEDFEYILGESGVEKNLEILVLWSFEKVNYLETFALFQIHVALAEFSVQKWLKTSLKY